MIDQSAQYRVIDRRDDAKIGSVIEFRGVPGLSLLPLSDSARAAKAATIEPRHYGLGCATTLPMARSLGFIGTDARAARQFIKSFLAEEIQKERP